MLELVAVVLDLNSTKGISCSEYIHALLLCHLSVQWSDIVVRLAGSHRERTAKLLLQTILECPRDRWLCKVSMKSIAVEVGNTLYPGSICKQHRTARRLTQ